MLKESIKKKFCILKKFNEFGQRGQQLLLIFFFLEIPLKLVNNVQSMDIN